ncbi:hypothetical protein DAI22_05g081700 [Oryza sativa Japonica Group]|nr:hypothetical protein DAI22_05g081700 [Oryza sativa Japonica Group]
MTMKQRIAPSRRPAAQVYQAATAMNQSWQLAAAARSNSMPGAKAAPVDDRGADGIREREGGWEGREGGNVGERAGGRAGEATRLRRRLCLTREKGEEREAGAWAETVRQRGRGRVWCAERGERHDSRRATAAAATGEQWRRRQARSRVCEPGSAARVYERHGDDGWRRARMRRRRLAQRRKATVAAAWLRRRARWRRCCDRLRARRAQGLGFGPAGQNLRHSFAI